ncbi:hypothetical protein EC973_002226 [Apophysomyces ossiformis]|uniref:Amino acid transporter transmembrane domain-containing protein n=1 Tax=Apophysomyces ossiformis TaxID=679940 RepID=A0A8H7BYE1_9FUNG|nr:hypothetical protein EC973_002226 [Apophysomyces ossiformis]
MSFDEKKQYSTEHVGSIHDVVSDHEFNFPSTEKSEQHKGGSFLAYYNVVCVVAGTGTLGIPYALKQGGWIGLLILFLAWTMSVYTGIILIKCLYTPNGTRRATYKDVATAAFGPIGGWLTFFFNAWILVGAPVLYMVLSGSNLNALCKGTAGEIGQIPWTIISCAAMAIPFIIVKSMKEVAWMSAFGAFATLATVLIVLVVACIHQSTGELQNIEHDSVIWEMFPIALSTISFSFGGNVVYPHVEASMTKPKRWPLVVGAGLSTCALMYILIAVPGYYIYGRTVLSPIYDSIPRGVPQLAAIVLMTIHVLMASPILLTSFSLDLEEMFNITVDRFGKWKELVIRAVLRILIMGVVTVIACVVPHFDNLMSLIGAFANCALIFILPVGCYWRLTGFRNKNILELAWGVLIILLGIVGLIFGTKESIEGLIQAFGGKSH